MLITGCRIQKISLPIPDHNGILMYPNKDVKYPANPSNKSRRNFFSYSSLVLICHLTGIL